MIPSFFNRRIPFRLLQRLCSHAQISIGAHRISVPLYDAAALGWLYWQPSWKSDLFGRLLRRRSGALVDVGANVGQSLADFLSTGATVPYIGLEPNVRCMSFLKELVSASRLANIRLIPVGLWNHAGQHELLLDPDIGTDATATLRSDLRPTLQRQSEWITTARLDDLLVELGQPAVSLVKIDIEGSELEALEGMTGLLTAAAPPVLCEVLLADPAADLELYRSRVERLSALLRQYGYSMHRITISTTGTFQQLQPIVAFPIARWSPQHANACDYLFLPTGYDITGLTTTATARIA